MEIAFLGYQGLCCTGAYWFFWDCRVVGFSGGGLGVEVSLTLRFVQMEGFVLLGGI